MTCICCKSTTPVERYGLSAPPTPSLPPSLQSMGDSRRFSFQSPFSLPNQVNSHPITSTLLSLVEISKERNALAIQTLAKKGKRIATPKTPDFLMIIISFLGNSAFNFHQTCKIIFKKTKNISFFYTLKNLVSQHQLLKNLISQRERTPTQENVILNDLKRSITRNLYLKDIKDLVTSKLTDKKNSIGSFLHFLSHAIARAQVISPNREFHNVKETLADTDIKVVCEEHVKESLPPLVSQVDASSLLRKITYLISEYAVGSHLTETFATDKIYKIKKNFIDSIPELYQDPHYNPFVRFEKIPLLDKIVLDPFFQTWNLIKKRNLVIFTCSVRKVRDYTIEVAKLPAVAGSSLAFLSPRKDELRKLKEFTPIGPFTKLPPPFFSLTSLMHLNLKKCQLEFLPSAIGNFRQLKNINLSDNELRDLPLSFGNLPEIEYINLENNRFNTIPLCLLKLHRHRRIVVKISDHVVVSPLFAVNRPNIEVEYYRNWIRVGNQENEENISPPQ